MKKIWGWILGIIVVLVLAFYFIFNGSSSTSITTNNPGTSGGSTTPVPATTSAGAGSAGGTGAGSGSGAGGTASTGQYKDGTYTGPVTDAIYGQLQVVVTIQNGKIVNTTCPIYPNSPGHSSEVSAMALPQLKQEAIASQSANVNVVSGATQTSEAYQQSLAAALTQAQG